MLRPALATIAAVAIGVPVAVRLAHHAKASSPVVPVPVLDVSAVPAAPGTAVFAGGCFWGVEAVFEHLIGVIDVVSGYAGGSAESARYDLVGTGSTGHAEAVQVTFDPARITYGQLLQVFFSVAHDPTELNRQGPDVGPQYRSAIFYADEEQARVARAYIAQLSKAGLFTRPIVTEMSALRKFYPAEAYHQDYMARNPNDLYILIHDRPKIARLEKSFPALYQARRSGG
jgi:peptide-methionine (S)-S-oxide reductase